ncbi:histidine phosphotransferase family protein [Yoonia sp. I 8.24]|uniref:histidine phosphotransferase family protein n=1 Tax=Yoonia sp. I 8.24 TaxID=1537229 RepID=UPI001EDD92F9|nr:histidine phosphotransferase family protein [Yoonia sp. I 8.24]MCG3267710.1 histidine phosphotransferase [Yoonia sp. I 8.24]
MHPDLAALVGSRICHDLISPIGAIGNGIELLELTSGDTAPEMALINDSVHNANARIRLFRIAFGAVGEDQRVSSTEVQDILNAVARGGRHQFHWNISGDQPRHVVRLALLVLLCFETALPMGGEITATCTGDEWLFDAHAKRVTIDADLWACFGAEVSNHRYTAAQVQFALLPPALAAAARSLTFEASETRLTARF